MTPQGLQDAIVDDIKKIFAHSLLKDSLGAERNINVYPQDVPIREGDDEGIDAEIVPEPYVIVRLSGGKTDIEASSMRVAIAIIVCVYDTAHDRQGYRDAMHIINEIYRRYASNGVIGERYVLQYPIEWATQEEDTHPYYYAGLVFNVDAPAVRKEVPFV